MRSLVEHIARALVNDPGAVEVRGEEAMRLHVAPADLGRVIGQQGRTARSIRTIVTAAAAKAGKRGSIEIAEE